MHSEAGRVGIFHEEMIQKKGLTEQVWRTESSDMGGSKRKSNWIFGKKGEATKSQSSFLYATLGAWIPLKHFK